MNECIKQQTNTVKTRERERGGGGLGKKEREGVGRGREKIAAKRVNSLKLDTKHN